MLFISSTKNVTYAIVPPEGFTGAAGMYCTNCHNEYPLNALGGSVTLAGLPTGNYVPNATYNLSLKINHSAADRYRWGFSMKAIGANGDTIGSFISANSNAAVNGNELSHLNAVVTPAQNSFTYDSLKWKAPATPGSATFYYVAVASDNSYYYYGDYVYAGSSIISLPIELINFEALVIDENIKLQWTLFNNNNDAFFDIERSDDGQFFYKIGSIHSSNNINKDYSFIDDKVYGNYKSKLFYRLKTIDNAGKIKYSKQISIQPKNNGLLVKKVYPTIIKKNESITAEVFSDKVQYMSIRFINSSNSILYTTNTILQKGKNVVVIVPQNINSNGIAFVQLFTSTFNQTYTIIVQ